MHLLITPGGHSGDEQVGVVNFGPGSSVDEPRGRTLSEPATFDVTLDWYNQILRDPPQNQNATTAAWKKVRYFEMGTNPTNSSFTRAIARFTAYWYPRPLFGRSVRHCRGGSNIER